jgi:hypothetical protein
VPHLAHRRQIYLFPNPWQAFYWGSAGENQHDPADIDWLVIDTPLLGESRQLWDDGLAGGEFEIVFDQEAIAVARRVP